MDWISTIWYPHFLYEVQSFWRILNKNRRLIEDSLEEPLYHQIAESIRQQILRGEIKPGERLPPVRQLTQTYHCTPGTIQRAYHELASQGLVISRAGQGTQVMGNLLGSDQRPLRRATLVNRAEAFLLEVISAGYSLEEISQSFHLAMDRWRTADSVTITPPDRKLKFVGSHDPVMDILAKKVQELTPGTELEVSFSGSLGGLIAMVEGRADFAGIHLWDEITQEYNVPFVKRLLPGRKIALVTLCHRRLGLIMQPEMREKIHGLRDLSKPEVKYINRQPGSGTRVWFDAQLKELGISPFSINGYTNESPTHSNLARAIAENQANVGLGLEALALAYGLAFVFMTQEKYDLVIPAEYFERFQFQQILSWLQTGTARQAIESLGGYDASQSGSMRWVT